MRVHLQDKPTEIQFPPTAILPSFAVIDFNFCMKSKVSLNRLL